MEKKIKIIIFLVICLIIILAIVIPGIIEENKTKESFKNMGNGAKDYYEGINNAHSHIDEFTYNRNTGVVEYHPKNK